MIEGGKQEREQFAWLTLPDKREVGTPRVSSAQHLTVFVRDGRHHLKVVSFNVNVGKQFSFTRCSKEGRCDKDKKAEAETSKVNVFADSLVMHLCQIWSKASECC